VFRSDALRRTAIHGSYIGSDIPLQAEVALYGKIWEIPDYLFLRRMHAEAQSAMSAEERVRHYEPTATTVVASSHWRHLTERLRSVVRAPIPVAEKARIAAIVGRQYLMCRDEMFVEAVNSVRAILRRRARIRAF
jgi:hypothetical protein